MSKFTVLVGRSASGKDAILKKLASDYNYIPLISCTTRPKRDGEADNITYYFISDDKFKSMIKDNKLIEYRSYNTLVKGVQDTWFYGLSKSEIDRMYDNQSYVVVLDLQGAKSLIDYIGKDKCEVIYIDCPYEIRKERAIKRGGYDEIEWDRRYLADLTDFSEQNRIGLVDREIKNWNRNLNNVTKEVVNENKFNVRNK